QRAGIARRTTARFPVRGRTDSPVRRHPDGECRRGGTVHARFSAAGGGVDRAGHGGVWGGGGCGGAVVSGPQRPHWRQLPLTTSGVVNPGCATSVDRSAFSVFLGVW